MNMFEEIDSLKTSLPKINIRNEANKIEWNVYQKFGLFIIIVALIAGVVSGDLNSTCANSSDLFTTGCSEFRFNLFYMLEIWFVGFLLGLSFFAVGRIISLLEDILEKTSKK